LNTNILNIVKRITNDYGEGILADPLRLKPLFADYAKNEFKEDRVAFGRCIEMGFYNELKRTQTAEERQRLKLTLANQMVAKTGIDKQHCNDALDLLETVVFGVQQYKKIYCKKCGKELQNSWLTCPYCFASASNTSQTKTNISHYHDNQVYTNKQFEEFKGITTNKEKSGYNKTVIAVVLIIVGSIIAYFAYQEYKEYQAKKEIEETIDAIIDFFF